MSPNNHNPKIIITTLPLREIPSHFPPMGALTVITSLKQAGFTDTHFYNVDLFRSPFGKTTSDDQVINYLTKEQPDILGISAVVSTGYAVAKKLSIAVKKFLPNTTILLGGNLGASAEVILHKTGIDYICTGEGEKTVVDFVKCWLAAKTKSAFADVEGLAFLDEKGDLINTAYPEPIAAEDAYEIDWSILEELGEMSYYVKNYESERIEIYYGHDPRRMEHHRKGKTFAHLSGSKGCVARCTFCHRWDKGIRYIPVPIVMKRLDYLIKKHNVGFVSFGDENFGTDKRWLGPFIDEISKRDLIWSVSGMRVNCIDEEWIVKMKAAGCSSIVYGMESGSQKMLDIMEKRTTTQQNRDALKWTVKHKLDTVVQLVIGMPGETPETINESADFCSYFVEQNSEIDPNNLSINFAQALPGTPLYETARSKGLIESSMEGEEKYLLQISNRDARDGKTFMNMTDFPQLVVENWYFEICSQARIAYIKKWGIDSYWKLILRSIRFKSLNESQRITDNLDTGYFASPAREKKIAQGVTSSTLSKTISGNKKSLAENEKLNIPDILSLLKQSSLSSASSFYPRFFWHTRCFSIIFTFLNCVRKYGLSFAIKMLAEYFQWQCSRPFSFLKNKEPIEYISLRKLLRKKFFPNIPTDNPVMDTLRKGR